VSPDFHELTYYKYHYGPRAARVRPPSRRLSDILHPRTWLSPNVVRVAITLVALGLGLWIGRTALEARAASWARSAPATAPSEPDPVAPAPAEAPESYSLGLPVPGSASGQVLVGQFATTAEAAAFGEELVREGVIAGFRIVAADGR
jgi:hypothetical protein